MKNLFFIFSLFAVCLSSFAMEPFFWYINDNAVVDAALMELNAAENKQYWNIARWECLKELNLQGDISFQQVCSTISSICTAEKLHVTPSRSDLVVKRFITSYVQDTKKFLNEGFAYAKAHPSEPALSFYLYSWWYDTLGITPVQRYNGLVTLLLDANLTHCPHCIAQAINLITELAVNDDITTQKADLQKLNRKYSAMLATQKEAYEPIVVAIRTALETY